MFDTILDLVFPSLCAGCGIYLRHGKTACDACLARIPLHQTLSCAVCGARLPDSAPVCHRDAPYILGAASSYADPTVRALIHRLKFEHAARAAEPLAELIVRYLHALEPQPAFDCIVPIPLGRKRERLRGFNQSALLAEYIAQALEKPLIMNALVRTRETAPQSELSSREERRENMAGSFTSREALPKTHRTILLIDDVTTSGATLREAAEALHKAGAHRVIALVAAKA